MKKALLILLLILCSCGGSKNKSPQVKPLQKHTIKYWVCPLFIGYLDADINYLNKYDFYVNHKLEINYELLMSGDYDVTFEYEFEAYEGDQVYLELNSMSGNSTLGCLFIDEDFCDIDIIWAAAINKDGEPWLTEICTIKKYNHYLDSYQDGDCDSIILEGII